MSIFPFISAPAVCLFALSLGAACSGSAGVDPSDTAGTTGTSTATEDETGTTDLSATESAGTDTASTDTDTDTNTAETDDTLPPPEPVSLTLIEEVVFYDGYAATVDEPVPEGIVRHSNALYATKLADDDLASIQNTLNMRVYIGALCDNYDRIGGVFLSLVPKGSDTYVPAEVTRYEIARFITPFMNMNKKPDIVPYAFDLANLVPLITDPAIQAEYDLWFELSVFGVPYAANTEVAGCDGRSDVFLGALLLDSDSTTEAQAFDFTTPLATYESLNNYQENATDELGFTRKTIDFSLDDATSETQLVLITSNHGANQGGEEYSRREHYVGIDDTLVHQYKPGRESCEPFRMYNTQGNGIYGPSPKTDAQWQSFSNWCPGDIIDTRIIPLGAMSAGAHHFVIEVPDAKFVNGEGNIPLSLYIQGR